MRYGAIEALRGVSLDVREGELVAIVGANGAGKTTLMSAISALVPIAAGTIRLRGRPLPARPHEVVAAGIVQVVEGRGILSRLTVLDNLLLGATRRRDAAGVQRDLESELSRFPILRERLHQPAGVLSGGEQQMLAFARALMARPSLLLLDEPSMGLAPLVVRHVFRLIAEIRGRGVTVLLVEQNARMSLEIADRAYVLENGRIVGEGTGRDLLEDPAVVDAYLGT